MQLEGNFRYELEILGVCTHEHTTVDFSASMRATNQLEVNVTARADWGLLFGAEIPLTRTTSEFANPFWFWKSEEFDIGLRQVYGDGPGLYVVRFDITFPTLGDETRDKDYLEDFFGYSSLLETTYFEHKEE